MPEASETGLYPALLHFPKEDKTLCSEEHKGRGFSVRRLQTWAYGQGALLCWERSPGQGTEQSFQKRCPPGACSWKNCSTICQDLWRFSLLLHLPSEKGLVALPRALPSGLVQALGTPLPWPLPAHPTSSIYCNPSHLLGHLVYTPPHTHYLCWPREASFLRASFHEYHLSLA